MEGTRVREPIPGALQRVLDGRYVLERRLGRGGMGVVYLAREPRLARRVAIKVLPPERTLQPAARERFLREARTAAGLSHPNIVPIFAVDEVDDFVFFVMAYVDGESLGQRIRTRGPLPPAEVARVLKQVARALAYAHDHGVVPYYVLAGRLPFEERDAYALMARHATEPAPPLASVAPAVPRPLARMVDRCLAKEPWARFAGGSELAEAIDHAVPLQAASPIAVRAFLVESRHLSGPALVDAALAGLALPLLAGSFWSGETLATKLLAAGGVAWVLLFPLGYMVRRLHRLFAAGYEREDLVEVLEAALARRREELAFLYGEGPSGFERTMRRLSYAALVAAAAVVGLSRLEPALLPDASLFAAFGVSALAALLAAIVARARTEHRTDPKAERRLRFWRGPLGRGLCRVAALGLRVPPVTAPYRLADGVAPPPP